MASKQLIHGPTIVLEGGNAARLLPYAKRRLKVLSGVRDDLNLKQLTKHYNPLGGQVMVRSSEFGDFIRIVVGGFEAYARRQSTGVSPSRFRIFYQSFDGEEVVVPQPTIHDRDPDPEVEDLKNITPAFTFTGPLFEIAQYSPHGVSKSGNVWLGLSILTGDTRAYFVSGKQVKAETTYNLGLTLGPTMGTDPRGRGFHISTPVTTGRFTAADNDRSIGVHIHKFVGGGVQETVHNLWDSYLSSVVGDIGLSSWNSGFDNTFYSSPSNGNIGWFKPAFAVLGLSGGMPEPKYTLSWSYVIAEQEIDGDIHITVRSRLVHFEVRTPYASCNPADSETGTVALVIDDTVDHTYVNPTFVSPPPVLHPTNGLSWRSHRGNAFTWVVHASTLPTPRGTLRLNGDVIYTTDESTNVIFRRFTDDATFGPRMVFEDQSAPAALLMYLNGTIITLNTDTPERVMLSMDGKYLLRQNGTGAGAVMELYVPTTAGQGTLKASKTGLTFISSPLIPSVDWDDKTKFYARDNLEAGTVFKRYAIVETPPVAPATEPTYEIVEEIPITTTLPGQTEVDGVNYVANATQYVPFSAIRTY